MKVIQIPINWAVHIPKFRDRGLGIENLVAVAIDSVKVARAIATALKDGIQLSDAFTLFNQFPAIQHVAEIAPTAFSELRDLTPEESAEAAKRIADGTGLPNDASLWGKVRQALALSARTYKVVDDGLAVGHEWKNLFETSPELAQAA